MLRHIIEEIGDILVEIFRKEEVWFVIFVLALGGAVFFLPFFNASEVIALFLRILKKTWWFWFFVILFPVFESLWLFWRQEIFKSSIKWTLLEIKIPREVNKSPQAMEQVLRALHALRNSAGDIREKYWDGEVTVWFSFEIVRFGGEVRFFVRGQKKQRNLIEAAFFSYYPDIEIVEVEDYVNELPQSFLEMQDRNLEVWGTEMVLAREDAYPIKTYPNFREEEAIEEKKVPLDPISAFLEVLGKVKKGEFVGIQILAAPADPKWAENWRSILEKLQEPALMEVEEGSSEEGAGLRQIPIARTPGQTDILEAVEQNLSKPAFDTLIRFIYYSPKEIFYDSFARRGLTGAFNQYSALNLNSFRANYPTQTRTQIWNWPHIFPVTRNVFRKQRLIYNYNRREVPPETWMGRFITSHLFHWNFASKRFQMNVEGLATLFHPPTSVVLTAPHIRRVESRKTGPPAGLAIFGEEGEIEKYK